MTFLRNNARIFAATAVIAVGLAACGTDDEPTTDGTTPDATQTTPDSTETETMGEMESAGDPFDLLKTAVQVVGPGGSAEALAGGLDQALDLDGDVASPASQLLATTTTLLQEHVYLAGIAVDAAYSFGPESAEFGLAAGALDKNSVEIADLIGSVAPDQRDAFLDLWRQHIGFFVNYALGAAAGDQAMIDQAKADLANYGVQSGQFFESVTGGALPADAVEANLASHVSTLGAAIEAFAAGDADAFDDLREAALHMKSTAAAIAGAVVQATGMEGDINSPAAQTFTTLSQLLEEHVFLAGIAVKVAYAEGGDLNSPVFGAAAATLDANSVDLADVVGSVAPDQRDAFLDLWRQHIGFFVDYAVGEATGDEQMKQDALTALDGYGDQSGAFFESISGGVIPASAVKGSLQKHIDTLTPAIDALKAAILG